MRRQMRGELPRGAVPRGSARDAAYHDRRVHRVVPSELRGLRAVLRAVLEALHQLRDAPRLPRQHVPRRRVPLRPQHRRELLRQRRRGGALHQQPRQGRGVRHRALLPGRALQRRSHVLSQLVARPVGGLQVHLLRHALVFHLRLGGACALASHHSADFLYDLFVLLNG